MAKCRFDNYLKSMVTVQISPPVGAESVAQPEHVELGARGRRHSARSMMRSARIILDTTWRVVLFGGEINH
jgi:hypothetical protein